MPSQMLEKERKASRRVIQLRGESPDLELIVTHGVANVTDHLVGYDKLEFTPNGELAQLDAEVYGDDYPKIEYPAFALKIEVNEALCKYLRDRFKLMFQEVSSSSNKKRLDCSPPRCSPLSYSTAIAKSDPVNVFLHTIIHQIRKFAPLILGLNTKDLAESTPILELSSEDSDDEDGSQKKPPSAEDLVVYLLDSRSGTGSLMPAISKRYLPLSSFPNDPTPPARAEPRFQEFAIHSANIEL